MCGQQRAVARQAYGSSTERPSVRSDSNAESDAVRWRQSAQHVDGQYSTQQRAGRTKHSGGRLQRHIDRRVRCYVHKRVQQQQYRQLRTIDFQFQRPFLARQVWKETPIKKQGSCLGPSRCCLRATEPKPHNRAVTLATTLGGRHVAKHLDCSNCFSHWSFGSRHSHRALNAAIASSRGSLHDHADTAARAP